jgi:chemotaxis protein methyltransferase CheR
MNDTECVAFLQWALPKLRMRWPGFRKVRRQVCRRVDRRMRELGLRDVAAYRALLESDPHEWHALHRCCPITISRFYRDRGIFDLLRDAVLPQLTRAAVARGDHQFHAWSAGCASGEELYTLKILWELCLRPRFPRLRLHIVATDVEQAVLERARIGCYSKGSLQDLPHEWLATAFVRRDSLYCVRPEFRDGIDLQLQDIRQAMPPGPFDLILCRHLVFTYFDEQVQQELLPRLAQRLVSRGVLVTGKQEMFPASGAALFRAWGPRLGIYEKLA